MGQGLYDAVGWGILTPPCPLEEEAAQRYEDLAEAFGLHEAYETTPEYLVLPLAVSDPVLQEWWDLPPLPLWVPRVAPRTARYIFRVSVQDVEALAGQSHRDLSHWGVAQAHFLAQGFTLPPAHLIVLNDWD